GGWGRGGGGRGGWARFGGGRGRGASSGWSESHSGFGGTGGRSGRTGINSCSAGVSAVKMELGPGSPDSCGGGLRGGRGGKSPVARSPPPPAVTPKKIWSVAGSRGAGRVGAGNQRGRGEGLFSRPRLGFLFRAQNPLSTP